MFKRFRIIRADLRFFVLFPKRHPVPKGLPAEQWHAMAREQARLCQTIRNTDLRWRVITFKDGSKELSYLTTRDGGVYRGLVFRRPLQYWDVTSIRAAF
jgi:hypothetical protein